MSALGMLSAAQTSEGFRTGLFSPVDVAKDCLNRIEALNDRFGAFCFVDRKEALAMAEASHKRWQKNNVLSPFDGIPATIKDLVLVKGWPTFRGSLTTKSEAEDQDAPAVANLRAAGAVFLGKTTTPEFGWKAVTDNPRGDIARNPHNPAKTAGGSSGGAAIAAALGMGVWHLGSDGGGSIRIPSSFCGIFGLKPTFGRVPAWPLSPFGTVSHLGPMTRHAEDARAMLEIISRPDPNDWHCLPEQKDFGGKTGAKGIQGWRVAASKDLGHISIHQDISTAFEKAVARLEGLGAKVSRLTPPVPQDNSLFKNFWYRGAANLLDGIQSCHYHKMDPGLIEIAEAGRMLDARTLRHADLDRGGVGQALQQFFDDFDLLVTPSTALTAFDAGHEFPLNSSFGRWIDWAGFSHPFNLSQQPAANLPIGSDEKGLPIGLQIIGPKYREDKVLRAAAALEQAGFGFEAPSP